MKQINLLFFCSDYMVGLTQALTEQAIELSKVDSLNLYCVSSEKEMEPGLHNSLRNNDVNVNIIESLDVHDGFKNLAEKVAEIIKEREITHVNVHNNWQLGIVAYIKYILRPRKFKIIYTIHGYRHNSAIKQIPAIFIIGMALLLFTNRVISMSSYVSKKFRMVGYKTDLVFYMMNKAAFFKTENRIFTDRLRLVFPAQFRHGKRQEILIRAVGNYISRTGDRTIELILPGEGPLLSEMKMLAKELKLENNVFFPGKLAHKDVISLYEECNIALCSSNVETYGRCIAEPFALGRCVITQPTGVALDIINNDKNGMFFTDSKSLSDILVNLKNRPEKISSMANQAFIDKNIFSVSEVMKSYLNVVSKA